MPTHSNKKWYSMKAANNTADIDIYTDIGFWGITAQDFRKELKSHGKLDHINLSINSYGGEVYDGFAIYNDLKETGASVTVTIKGIAASIASYIAMAGDKINIHKNAMMMIHNPAVMMAGEAKDLRKEADVLDNMKDTAVKAYRTHAKNLSDEDIVKMMDDTTYMTADKAVAFGFADAVLDAVDVEEPETNMKFSVPLNYRKSIFTNQIPAGNVPAKQEVAMKCPKCGKHDISEGQTTCIECARAQERAEAVNAERSRITNIDSICEASGLSSEFKQKMVASGKSIDQLSTEIADEIRKMKAKPPVEPVAPGSGVVVNKDEAEKFRMHAVNAVAVMTGIEKDPTVKAEVRKGEMIGSLHGLMRRDLQRHGVDSIGMNAGQLADAVIRMAGTGSSDLPAILGDITNKNLLKSFDEAPTTYQQWTGTREVSDFKTQKLIKMSNFGDIDDLPEGSVFKNKKMSDQYNTVAIDTKGNTFNVSRQALINDDLGAIVDVPRKMVMAVRRRINKDVYDSLTSQSLTGPTLVDGAALFSAGHSNMTTGALSISTLATAERLLLEMPLPKPEANSTAQYANIPAKFFIAGTASRLTALQLLNTAFDNSKSIAGVFNPYASGAIIPIFDAYLQAKLTAGSRANAYYLASDPSLMGHCIVAFLQGQTTPMLRSEQSGVGDAQGFTWEISFDWGIGWEDHRGIIYSAGQ